MVQCIDTENIILVRQNNLYVTCILKIISLHGKIINKIMFLKNNKTIKEYF